MSNTISTINITKFNEIYTYEAILLRIFYIKPPVFSNQSRKINQHQDTTQQSHQVPKPQR